MGKSKWCRLCASHCVIILRLFTPKTPLYNASNLERVGTNTCFYQPKPLEMGTRKPLLPLASFCMVFAMLLAMAMSNSSWPNSQVKDSVAFHLQVLGQEMVALLLLSLILTSSPHHSYCPSSSASLPWSSCLGWDWRVLLILHHQYFECNFWVSYFYLLHLCSQYDVGQTVIFCFPPRLLCMFYVGLTFSVGTYK